MNEWPDGRLTPQETPADPDSTRPMRVYLLGLPIDWITLEGACDWILAALRSEGAGGPDAEGPREPARLVVTLNPEIVVRSRSEDGLAKALHRADLSVADGVGITWAARRARHPLPGRVPGIDLVRRVLEVGGADVKVYLLGGKPGVAFRAAEAVTSTTSAHVVGWRDGYFRRPEQVEGVCREIRDSGANLLLAGLGEDQERFLHENGSRLGVKVMVGVGGTLDVWAGEVRRMPAWTSRLGVEWLFRVVSDTRRWRRVPRLIRFVMLVLTRTRR